MFKGASDGKQTKAGIRERQRERERERNEFSKWNEKLAEITQRFHKYRTKYFRKKGLAKHGKT